MQTAFKDEETVHLGYNIKRIREIIGIKQTELGAKCNGGWSQQQISKLENLEVIDESTLGIVAEGLGVTSEFIKNFKEEKAIYNIQNNNDNATQNANYIHTANYQPVEKIVEIFEKFMAEDKQKTALIEKLTSAVASLAEKVEALKGK